MLHGSTGIAYLAAAAVFGWIAVVTWRRRLHNPTVAVSLVVVSLGLALSSLADAVAVTSSTQKAAAIASLAILPGVGIATGAFVCLAVGVARPQWAPPGWLIAALMIEPVLITVVAATNPLHLWVYRGAGAEELTGSEGWGYGPAFWWHTGYSYLALAVGIGFLVWGWWKAPAAFRRQRLTILLATVIACAANVVYLSRGFGEHVDPTPFGFAVAGMVIFYAIFRQDLITVSPVARALVFDQIGEAVLVVSPAGMVLDLNPAAVDLLRRVVPHAPSKLVGVPARTLIGETLALPDGQERELVVEVPGTRAEFQVRASLLIDRYNRSLGTVFVARDVTEANNQVRRLEAAHAKLVEQVAVINLLRADLAELASHDSLTGLHNRRHLAERVSAMIAAAERSGECFAVVLLDIDRFKAVNDLYGHQAGDAVLVGLARLMRDCAPTDALVARWGGEEFFVALPTADGAAGLAFADDLRRRWERNAIAVGSQVIDCTLSAGVAVYPASGTSMDELFHAVDRSLYEAKGAGRNLVRVHDPGGALGPSPRAAGTPSGVAGPSAPE